MDDEPIFLSLGDGRGGVNFRFIKRWKMDGTTLEVTVEEGNGQITHFVHGDDAVRCRLLLEDRTG